MMKKSRIFLILSLLFVNISYADIVNINVPANEEEVKSVTGIIVKKGEIHFVDNVNYNKSKNNIIFSLNVDGNDTSDLVGVSFETMTGNKFYSELKTISEYFKDESPLPVCTSQKADVSLLAGQESALKELVATRKKRQELLKKEIETILSDDMIYILTNLEKYFGLTYDKALSPALPSEELLSRLSYIKSAIKNLDAHKQNRVRIEREGLSNKK